jgi:hypothetical protein
VRGKTDISAFWLFDHELDHDEDDMCLCQATCVFLL